MKKNENEKNEGVEDPRRSVDQDEDAAAAAELTSCLESISKCVARNPCPFLWVAILLAMGISAVGLIVGEFAIEVDSVGWWSRNTEFANRQMQFSVLVVNTPDILVSTYNDKNIRTQTQIDNNIEITTMNINNTNMDNDGPNNRNIWDELTSTVQVGFDYLFNSAEAENSEEMEKEEEEEEEPSVLMEETISISTTGTNGGGGGVENVNENTTPDTTNPAVGTGMINSPLMIDLLQQEQDEPEPKKNEGNNNDDNKSRRLNSEEDIDTPPRTEEEIKAWREKNGATVQQSSSSSSSASIAASVTNNTTANTNTNNTAMILNLNIYEAIGSSLLSSGSESSGSSCDLSFYYTLPGNSLWPIWKLKDRKDENTDEEGSTSTSSKRSIFDVDVVRDICIAETNTQDYLQQNGYCYTNHGCDETNSIFGGGTGTKGQCLPPYSIVLIARLLVGSNNNNQNVNGFEMTCQELAEAFTETPELLQKGIAFIQKDATLVKEASFGGTGTGDTSTANEKEEEDDTDSDTATDDELQQQQQQVLWPYGYYPALVDSDFVTTGISTYTSSIFDTAGVANVTLLYDALLDQQFDRGTKEGSTGTIEGVYDTAYEAFVLIKTESMLAADMILALGSAGVIAIAIMLHTQSPFLTVIGLLQIVLSFPIAFFVYKLCLGLQFFPFLNFMGIFVVFALGAGDIYVAFDKWTNHRTQHPLASTEYVAAKALPESLSAMFLTTLTTAIAFFATAICPVAPIKMFAIFCGLLIIFDYVLTVLFIFPALCIYDTALVKRASRSTTSKSSCCSCLWMGCISVSTIFRCCTKTNVYDNNNKNRNDQEEEDNNHDPRKNYTVVQKFLLWFSRMLFQCRWPLLLLCGVAFGFCGYFATKFSLPESSDVRLLGPNNEYEKAAAWRTYLLSSELQSTSGSSNFIVWGLQGADTGDTTNPVEGTQLVLDDTFEPSSTEAQLYLRSFCDTLYEQEFASLPDEEYVCPMKRFDDWLSEQSTAANPEIAYIAYCENVNRLPVPEDKFHACMSNWALTVQEPAVLSRDDIIQVIHYHFKNSGIFDDAYEILEEQRVMIEEWMTEEMDDPTQAPVGVAQGFFVGVTYYWHDTNGSIIFTAYSGAGIALAASAAIILLSSKSVLLTIFSTITILFILTSVTSMLSAIGWTLGFIEAICFSILIGVSVDFVIHFTHAYVHPTGEVSRKERSQYAMITMGPSILATALTTFVSAVVMLFCTITFFQKFALVLFFTVVQATIGSFIFFITLINCFGPTNPTYLVDQCCGGTKKHERVSSSTTTSISGNMKSLGGSDEAEDDVDAVEVSERSELGTNHYNTGMNKSKDTHAIRSSRNKVDKYCTVQPIQEL